MNRTAWFSGFFLFLLIPALIQAANRPIIGVDVNEDIRVAYEVKDDVWDAGVGKALFYVRVQYIADLHEIILNGLVAAHTRHPTKSLRYSAVKDRNAPQTLRSSAAS
jgi:hypothetical protein